MRDLTPRLLDVLYLLSTPPFRGDRSVAANWARPMDVGGRDASHHSGTLARLYALGLAERADFGFGPIRRAWRYRITDAGLAALAGTSRGVHAGDAK